MAHTVDADFKTRLQNWIPKLVLSPSVAMMLVFVYGFILFSVYLSFTDSRLLPSYGWVGLGFWFGLRVGVGLRVRVRVRV